MSVDSVQFDANGHFWRAVWRRRPRANDAEQSVVNAPAVHETYADFVCGRLSPDYVAERRHEERIVDDYFTPEALARGGGHGAAR